MTKRDAWYIGIIIVILLLFFAYSYKVTDKTEELKKQNEEYVKKIKILYSDIDEYQLKIKDFDKSIERNNQTIDSLIKVKNKVEIRYKSNVKQIEEQSVEEDLKYFINNLN